MILRFFLRFFFVWIPAVIAIGGGGLLFFIFAMSIYIDLTEEEPHKEPTPYMMGVDPNTNTKYYETEIQHTNQTHRCNQ